MTKRRPSLINSEGVQNERDGGLSPDWNNKLLRDLCNFIIYKIASRLYVAVEYVRNPFNQALPIWITFNPMPIRNPNDQQDPTEHPQPKNPIPSAEEIRRRALEALHQGHFQIPEALLQGADIELASILESLRIYQAELELQNEELTRSQRQIQLALNRFGSFFNNLPIPALVIGAHGLIQEANLAARDRFRLRATQLHQHYFVRLIEEMDRERVMASLARLPTEDSGALVIPEVRLWQAVGRIMIADLYLARLPDLEGELEPQAHYLCSIVDRTELFQQYQALESTARLLQQRELELNQRLREMRGLYALASETSDPGQPLDAILPRLSQILVGSTRLPELAEVRLQLNGTSFQTPGFVQTPWSLAVPIPASGDTQSGLIELCYREAPPAVSDEGPFLDEERLFLETAAAHIALYGERRRANQALSESRERYQILADYSPDWEYWLGPDGRYLYVSPACSSIAGYGPESFIADPGLMGRLIHPADRALWERLLAEVLENHCSDLMVLHLRLIDRAGQEHWVEHLCNPVLTADGRYLGRRGVFREITERKRLESELVKLSLAVEQSPESIVITDLNGCIEYVNETFVRNTGYTRAEAIGQNPRILQSGQTPPERYEQLWGCLLAGEIWQGEFINRRKDGTLYTELATIAPIRQPDGRVTHFLAVKSDITEQRRLISELEHYRDHLAELVEERTRALRQQMRALQALIDNLPHLAWMKDREGRFVAVNRLFAELKGREPAELIGRTDEELWPERAPCYRAEDEEVIAGRTRITREVASQTKPGAIYEVFKAPIIDETGEVIGTVGSARDIRPQREMETELARRAELAESAVRAKSAFLANMSHEIRTPMNAILGLTHLLKRDLDDPHQLSRLDKIEGAARHLLTVINDILDLSKIEAGKLQLVEQNFSLAMLVDQVSSLVIDEARAKGLTLKIELDPQIFWVRGDITRLRQALLNYVSNAIKFTQRGWIAIRAHLEEQCPDGQLLIRFEVEDTGIGIPADKQATLFQAFEQADTSATRRYGGTGLGLAITAQLARLMGGTVGMTSQEGQGSIFWFTARLGVGQPQESDEQATQVALEAEARARCLGRRVLLAEDNPINREVIIELLQSFGLQVDSAENGQVASEMAARKDYDLILMDVQMPVMDGLTATRTIRTLPRWRDRPILALTANAFEEDRMTCLEAGMNDFVPKPVDPLDLLTALLRWLPESIGHPLPKDSLAAAQAPGPSPGATASLPKRVDLLAAIRVLPGVDLRQGLASLRGSQEGYIRLLERFIESHGNDPKHLTELLARGDGEGLARLAHSLKGVAGNLGLTRIAEQARALEIARRPEGLADPGALASTIASIREELESLHRAVEQSQLLLLQVSGASTAAGTSQTQIWLDQLAQLLREDNAQALILYQRESADFARRFPELSAALEHQINHFGFEGALRLVEQARARLAQSKDSDPD